MFYNLVHCTYTRTCTQCTCTCTLYILIYFSSITNFTSVCSIASQCTYMYLTCLKCVVHRDKNVFMQYSKHQELKMQQVSGSKIFTLYVVVQMGLLHFVWLILVSKSARWSTILKSGSTFSIRRSITIWRNNILDGSSFTTISTWCTPLSAPGHHWKHALPNYYWCSTSGIVNWSMKYSAVCLCACAFVCYGAVYYYLYHGL